MCRICSPLTLLAVSLSCPPVQTQEPPGGARPAVYFGIGSDLEFGVMTRDNRQLTYSANGSTSYTHLSIDGRLVRVHGQVQVLAPIAGSALPAFKQEATHRAILRLSEPVSLTQEVTIVDGKPSPGDAPQPRNTCRVRLTIANLDTKAHDIGLLTMVDTTIGGNDANWFVVPGKAGLVTTSLDLRPAREMPTYIKAIEKMSISDPGLTAYFTLKFGGAWAGPDRVCLTGRFDPVAWDFTPRNLGTDSAVAMQWSPQKLEPRQERKLTYAFGLGIAPQETPNVQGKQ